MCTQSSNCEEIHKLKEEKSNDLTKYWAVISGLVGLLITLVVFYANTSAAMDQVRDHEQRIRIMERTMTSSETLLKQISERVMEIDSKLDKHIESRVVYNDNIRR